MSCRKNGRADAFGTGCTLSGEVFYISVKNIKKINRFILFLQFGVAIVLVLMVFKAMRIMFTVLH